MPHEATRLDIPHAESTRVLVAQSFSIRIENRAALDDSHHQGVNERVLFQELDQLIEVVVVFIVLEIKSRLAKVRDVRFQDRLGHAIPWDGGLSHDARIEEVKVQGKMLRPHGF